MNFAEKKQAYHQLQDPNHLEADKELLLKKSPKSSALRVGMINREKAQCEIIWALLEVASMEEITANRPAPVKKLTVEEMKDITAEAAKLAAQVHKVNSLEEKAEIIAQIKELIKDFPEDLATIMLKLPESIIPDFVKIAEFTEKLLRTDVSALKQPEAAAFARGLNIEVPDYKLATLKPILQDFIVNLPKVSEGTGEKNTELPAGEELTATGSTEAATLESHSDQTIDIMNAEKQELEAENEELKEQLEDTEAEKEDLEEQLEEEKKSEAGPDPE